MKLPKNRTQIYAILRTGPYPESVPSICDSFRSLERAEEVLIGYEQQCREARLVNEMNDPIFGFLIQTSTYYDD